jgi:hypothetical protein
MFTLTQSLLFRREIIFRGLEYVLTTCINAAFFVTCLPKNEIVFFVARKIPVVIYIYIYIHVYVSAQVTLDQSCYNHIKRKKP